MHLRVRFAIAATTAIVACHAAASEPTENSISPTPLRVGIATVDITPPVGYPMSGYYYERGATGTLDPLKAKAIVLDDGTNRAAVVVCDLIGISTDLCQLVRQRASQEAEVPPENIMVAATHCHTGPDYYKDLRQYVRRNHANLRDDANDNVPTDYVSTLVSEVTKAVVKAASRMSTASLRVGGGTERSVSFNRRFVMSDGRIRTWANYRDPSVVRAAGPIDPSLAILLVHDQATKQPVGALSVFALHLDTTGGTQFSADFPFHLERTLQSKFGASFVSVFAAGTCGDINHVNPRSKERNRPHVIGSRLGQAFLDAADTLVDVQPSIRVGHRVDRIPLKSFTSDELKWAREVIARDKAEEELPFLDEVKAYNIRLLKLLRDGAGAENDGGQGWGVSASLTGVGESLPVEVQVIQLGEDTAIVGLPGEVFVELGLAIKQASPYRHTLVLELANSDEAGYIPTGLAYQGGGYETLNAVFEPGGGERLVQMAVQLLSDTKTAP